MSGGLRGHTTRSIAKYFWSLNNVVADLMALVFSRVMWCKTVFLRLWSGFLVPINQLLSFPRRLQY
jgi:hypothetical protein